MAVRILGILFSFLFLLLSVQAVNRAYEKQGQIYGKKGTCDADCAVLVRDSRLCNIPFYQIKSEMTGFYDVLCFYTI